MEMIYAVERWNMETKPGAIDDIDHQLEVRLWNEDAVN